MISIKRATASSAVRRASEKALEAGRLRDALGRTSIFLAQCDPGLRYTWVAEGNAAYLPHKVVGKTDEDLLPPETAQILNEAKLRALKEGQVRSVEVEIAVRGEMRRFISHFNPLRDEGQEIIGLSIVRFDVTEAFKSRQLRERSNATLQATTDADGRMLSKELSNVLEILPEIMVVFDAKGEVTFESAAAAELFSELGADGLPEKIGTRVRDAIKKGIDYRAVDYKAAIPITVGGRTREFLPHAIAIRSSAGRRRGALLLLQDITEFHLLDQVKSNLIGTVSHELRTPVTAVQFPLLLLLEESPELGSLTGMQRKFVEGACGQVDRLMNTLNMLLDLTRFEDGGAELDTVVTEPACVLNDAIEAVSQHVTMAGLEIELKVAKVLPPVRVDPQRIQHVLTNLITNAVKYSPRGSVLTIGARKLESGVRFYVTDRGTGIEKKFQGRLFERFFKVPGSDGTGLGLAIVREFVVAHGGTVGVESAPDLGSTFHFTLPEAGG